MIRNFEYLIVFTSTPGVLPEQNDRYQIQPSKVREIKSIKIHVNVPKFHLFSQYNFKKNTLWNIKSKSHCNDESVEPTSSNEAIFNVIGTFETVQP